MKFERIFLVLIFGVFCSFALASEHVSQKKQSTQGSDENATISVYTLSIESEPESITSSEIENRAKLKEPSRICDHLLVFINGNPVCFFSTKSSSCLKNINQYLKPGKNTVSLKGKHSKRVWIEIRVYETDNVNTFEHHKEKATLLEGMIYPQEVSHQWQESFNADVLYALPIFEKANEISLDETKVKKQAMTFLKDSHTKLREHNIAELKQISMKGSSIWEKLAYQQAEDEIDNKLNIMMNAIKQTEYPSFNYNNIKLILGPNLVMAYSGFGDGWFNNAYIWPVIQNKEKSYSPPVILAYIDNEWVWWE